MKKIVLSLGLLMLCCAGNVLAQGKPSWVTQLEETFKQREPQWKIEQILVHDAGSSLDESITFKSGGYRANVQLMIWDSVKNARDVFGGELIVARDSFKSRVAETKIENLGDENYFWPNLNKDGWSLIRYRKGRVIVRVFAPSAAMTKRFAQYVVERIPEK